MRHPIDPTVDCVFKALLGSEQNQGLLVHFLNAILGSALTRPIVAVAILNPYNEKEFLSDKLSVVDVKARDDEGRQFQIEIQLLNHRDLPARILYSWADLYSQQLREGQSYSQLHPTYCIWLVGEVLLGAVPGHLHRYQLRDDEGRCLLDHGGIWVVELRKFQADRVHSEADRWLKFFTEAPRLDEDNLPDWMQTDEMRQAMNTLRVFSEKERAYDAYQARQNFLRVQAAIEEELVDLRAEREAARLALEAEREQVQAERQLAELERQRAEAAQQRAETEQQRAEAERQRAEAEREAAETERQRAEEQQRRADAALAEVERLRALLDSEGRGSAG